MEYKRALYIINVRPKFKLREGFKKKNNNNNGTFHKGSLPSPLNAFYSICNKKKKLRENFQYRSPPFFMKISIYFLKPSLTAGRGGNYVIDFITSFLPQLGNSEPPCQS